MDHRQYEYIHNPRARKSSIIPLTWILKEIQKVDNDTDVYNSLPQDRCTPAVEKFEKMWNNELTKLKIQSKGYEKNSNLTNKGMILLRAIVSIFFWDFLTIFVLQLLAEFLMTMELYVFSLVLVNVKNDGWTLDSFNTCMVLLITTQVISVIINNTALVTSGNQGIKLYALFMSLIYRKCLRLNQKSLQNTSEGEIGNLMTVDTSVLKLICLSTSKVLAVPFSLALSLCVQYHYGQLDGVIAFVSVTLFTIIISGVLGLKLRKHFKFAIKEANKRAKIISQIISSIQIIKMYAWEIPFKNLVNNIYREEQKHSKKSLLINTASRSTRNVSVRLCYIVLLILYHLQHHYANIKSVYILLFAYYVAIIGTLKSLLDDVVDFTESQVSLRRICQFLMLEEMHIEGVVDEKKEEEADFSIIMNKVSARWNANNPSIDSVTLNIKKGMLVGVFGKLGSGKSTLINILLNQLDIYSGKLQINGIVSYASQTPWIFPSTIKQNILFGREMNKDLYDQVISSCAMQHDLKSFPKSDLTMVGEKGMRLSGGQKARINLARAIYKNADIFLLDDTLSAVDSNVGKHIFHECIQGFLKNKTRILVTHQTEYLPEMDYVIVMKNGKVAYQGFPSDLKNDKLEELLEISSANNIFVENLEEESIKFHSEKLVENDVTSQKNNIKKYGVQPTEEVSNESKSLKNNMLSFIMIGNSTYYVMFVILVMCLYYVMFHLSELFILIWVTYENLKSHMNNSTTTLNNGSSYASEVIISPTIDAAVISLGCLEVVFVSVAIAVALSIIGAAYMYTQIVSNSINSVFQNAINSLFATDITYFTDNPQGYIQNIFSDDLSNVMYKLPIRFHRFFQQGSLIVMVGVITYKNSTYVFFILYIILVISMNHCHKLIMSKMAPLLNHERNKMSIILGFGQTTIQGNTTVRVSGVSDKLVKEYQHLMDNYVATKLIFNIKNVSFMFIIQFLCRILFAALMVAIVQQRYEAQGDNLIYQIERQSCSLHILVETIYEICEGLGSFENLYKVCQLPPEEGLITTNGKPRIISNNPQTCGKLQFSHVYFSYKGKDHRILHDINFTILPNQKIGIVGRTGAGKTSIINAIFRMGNVEGIIKLNDMDTSTIQLHHLRSSMSIIPQDPVLFSATLRYNLDPLMQHSDFELWEVLYKVGLREKVKQLDMEVADGGNNISAGERQLICLCRAILRKSCILVMDEATANIDPTSDAKIQSVIKKEFEQRTVLIVAHRLNTVINCDKIMVISNGQMVEFDTPRNLMSNANTHFNTFIKQSNISPSDYL